MTGKVTIEITTGHCLGGEGNDVYPGQILEAPKDLSIADALKKVRMGYARIVPDAPEPEVEGTSGTAIVTQGDPVLESRDPEVEALAVAMPPEGRRGRSRTGGR